MKAPADLCSLRVIETQKVRRSKRVQDDCIAVALGLPQLRILKQKELEDHFEVTVIYRRGEVTCPRCGRVTNKEHDRRPQLKQDRRLRDKVVFLTLMKRRFRCLWCSKVFTEPDEVFGSRRRGQATGSGSTWDRKHFIRR